VKRITRRHWLQGVGTLLFGAAGAVFYAKRIEPHWLELTHRELALEDLPPNLEGRTLIHLSDLHVGPQVEDEYVIRTLRRAARLQPDFVVVTGDWISYRDDREIQQLDRVLRALPRGSLGGGLRSRRSADSVHQPRRRPPAAGAIQRPAGGVRLSADRSGWMTPFHLGGTR
jgi:hypothetical protein